MNPIGITEKEGEIQKLTEFEDGDLSSSPPIENLVERIGPAPVYNGLPMKRMKMENEDYVHKMPEIEDDCVAFGRCVTTQLKQMSKIQKLLAQRLMAEICFRGQIQALQMNTSLTTPIPVHQQQPCTFYASRSPHFSRGTEYMMYQQGIRPQVPASVHSNSHQQYQNFMNVQQQVEHTPTTSNASSTENMQ